LFPNPHLERAASYYLSMALRQVRAAIEASCGSVKVIALRLLSLCTPSELAGESSDKEAESSGSETDTVDTLQNAARRVAREFDFTGEDVRRGVDGFIQQMNDGLREHGSTIEQLPSFINAVPTGLEKVSEPIHSSMNRH
jgi:hypothetical protein